MSTTDSAGNVHRGAGAPSGGQFASRSSSQPVGSLADAAPDLCSQDPTSIDEQLYELYNQLFQIEAASSNHARRISAYRKRIDRDGHRPYRVADYERFIEQKQAHVDRLTAESSTVRALMSPFEAEYHRRGGWTRAFLVSGGHLHNTMDCSTCNRMGQMTRFAWMTQFSGSGEQEMVEAAGDRCCTVCFPSAPVNVLSRPSTLLTPDEEAAALARVAREEERTRKAAEKAAKAITNPDGSELREPRKYGQVVRTLVTAERELTDALLLAIVDDTPELSHWNREAAAVKVEWANILVTAIATKKGISEADVRAAALVKAQAKFKREYAWHFSSK
jgi:hypothetical protein